jgi:hypothetical protein
MDHGIPLEKDQSGLEGKGKKRQRKIKRLFVLLFPEFLVISTENALASLSEPSNHRMPE